eukprot:3348692-Rhodomonas_salina.1
MAKLCLFFGGGNGCDFQSSVPVMEFPPLPGGLTSCMGKAKVDVEGWVLKLENRLYKVQVEHLGYPDAMVPGYLGTSTYRNWYL